MDRKEWQDKAEASMKEWGAKIDDLRSKARGVYSEELNSLKEKYENASRKLKDLKTTSGGAWDNVRSGFENAFNEVKRSFENARSRFRH